MFKKAPLKPIVSLRFADEFNQLVSMDLKEVEIFHNTRSHHLIDLATRFLAACLVKTEKQEEIVKQIFSIWITYFARCTKEDVIR